MVTFILSFFLMMPLGDEAADARASAALALSKSKAPAAKDCGKCRTDLDVCRGEAAKTGKPLIVLVNTDCHTTAKDVTKAIFVRVTEYAEDGVVANKPRIVLIKPDLEGTLKIEKSISPMSGVELKKELFKTFPQLTQDKKLSWI